MQYTILMDLPSFGLLPVAFQVHQKRSLTIIFLNIIRNETIGRNFGEQWQRFGAQISLPTQLFIQRWLDLALNPEIAQTIATHPEARSHIQSREAALKRGQARLSNPRALELWQGESGTAPLDYRWGSAQRLLTDILDGFAQEDADVAA